MRKASGDRTDLRAGATLIETTVAIGVTTMILSVVFSVVATALRATQSGTAHLVECSALARIGRTFRDDVRAALTAAADTPVGGMPQRLVLVLANERRVEYRVVDRRLSVVRQHHGKTTSRDAIALPELNGRGVPVIEAGQLPERPKGNQTPDAWFRITPVPGGELISLLVADRRGRAPSAPLVFEAARGADHRFDERARSLDSSRRPQP